MNTKEKTKPRKRTSILDMFAHEITEMLDARKTRKEIHEIISGRIKPAEITYHAVQRYIKRNNL